MEYSVRIVNPRVPGIGKKRIKNICENIPRVKEFLTDILTPEDYEIVKNYYITLQNKEKNKLIVDKEFVFSGYMGSPNITLEDYIYENNGNITSSVTSNTEAVISANVFNVTSKMLKAREMGKKILSEKEFMREYKIILPKK